MRSHTAVGPTVWVDAGDALARGHALTLGDLADDVPVFDTAAALGARRIDDQPASGVGAAVALGRAGVGSRCLTARRTPVCPLNHRESRNPFRNGTLRGASPMGR